MPTSKICHILRRFVVPKSYANHVFALFGLEVSCIVKVSLRPGRSGPYSATVFFSFAYRFNFALCSNPPATTTTFAVSMLACSLCDLPWFWTHSTAAEYHGFCHQNPTRGRWLPPAATEPGLPCENICTFFFTYSAWRDIHPNPEDWWGKSSRFLPYFIFIFSTKDAV